MRLGATISRYGTFADPDAYVAECRRCGYRAAPCPRVSIDDSAMLRAIRQSFARADIVIAEVGAWVNPLHPRAEERTRHRATIAEMLAVADEVGARCCVTVAGSFDEGSMVGPHPDNFAAGTFEAVVEWVREILQAARPRRTRLALEVAPWTMLDNPEVYRRLIDAIDDPRLAVHLDPANCVVDARLYYGTTALLDRCFDLLGPWVVSCHAKDIRQADDPRTVSLMEVAPGQGILDYRTLVRRLEQVSPELPVIIEHLETEAEYTAAAEYIRAIAREVGAVA
jgi:sugar phosphate isomerase/epimerase